MSTLPAPIARAGDASALSLTRTGQSISARSGLIQWHHPWFIAPAWVAKGEGRWMATVKAGFVNDDTPVFQTTVRDQQEADLDFGINPLTGKPFFSDPIFARPEANTDVLTIAIPLTLNPAIPLTFRAIGYDALAPGEAVPQFFLDRGAAQKPRSLSDITDDDILASDTVEDLIPKNAGPPANLRLLRVCDLILHQPRVGLTSQILIEPGLATGQSHILQLLGVANTVPGDTLRVIVGVFTESSPPAIDPLSGDYTEPPYDEILIGKVWLLSPPGTAAGSDPDGSWQPFVSHALFWNLSYLPGVFRVPVIDPGIGVIPPLAFGAAQVVLNYFTSAISDMLQDALNIVTASSLAGTFWTPTGGGHDAGLPVVATPKRGGAVGLDKGAQIAAAQLAALNAKRVQQLDPDFPYTAMPFKPELLNP